jgi:hypothetical protein
VYNYHDSRACGYKRYGILSRLDGLYVKYLEWFLCSSCGLVRSIVTHFLDHTLRILIQLNWVVLAYNYNLVNRMLIIWESCICAFLLSGSLQLYFAIIPCLSFMYCTCWVPIISVLNLAIFTLRLKPAAQKMMVDWNSTMRSSRLTLPQLLSCGLCNLPLICLRESRRNL